MHAFKVLEYEAILSRLAKHCETSLGASLAEALQPTFEEEETWRRLAETDEAHRALARDSAPSLGPIRDLRSALIRASKGGTLGGQELFQVADTLSALRQMRAFLEPKQESAPTLWGYAESFPVEPKLETTLFDSLEPDGEVKDGASVEIAALRKRKTSAASRIIERIQSYVSGRSREYLSDPIYTVRDGRYVVPVKSEHRAKIKGILHDTSGSGQTVYIEPEDVLQLGNQLREIEGLEREEVQRVLGVLSTRVGDVGAATAFAIEQSAKVDLALAKARLGYAMEAAIPVRAAAASIKIDRGRHPLLDPAIVVPVTIEVGGDLEGLLITGPNTGGKTVAIKCVGLFALMAQSGLMLPARDVKFGPFSQIWADIGDEQSIQQSLSTFSGHIKNIAGAIEKLKPGALALFDELGAGTDPAEGAALAKAVLRAFRAKGARIVASTHYGELKAFAYSEDGFQNAAMEFDGKTLKPTYRLIMGAPGASHALKIAERYGIPKAIIDEAKEALGSQQQDVADMLEKLEQAQRQARLAQSQADKREAEMRKLEAAAEHKLAEADEVRRKANSRAVEEIEDVLREIRLEAAEIFEVLKKGGAAPNLDAARGQLKALQEIGTETAARFKKPEIAKKVDQKLEKGMSVRVDGYNQIGVLLEDPRGPQAMVQMGPLKVSVAVSKLSPEKQPPSANKLRPRQNMTMDRSLHATTEVSLRGMLAEAAQETLERFVDDAVLGGIHQVRIVHGKGEGILRNMTREYLRRRKEVASYRDGEPAEGGHGVTIAVMK